VESDLPKGYRGAAERSSNVGVPPVMWVSLPVVRMGVPKATALSETPEGAKRVSGVVTCKYPGLVARSRESSPEVTRASNQVFHLHRQCA